MTEKEYDDAANALIDWFKSQDIKPSDGALIMLKLIATQLVARTTDLKDLREAIDNIAQVVAIEVAQELRSKPNV